MPTSAPLPIGYSTKIPCQSRGQRQAHKPKTSPGFKRHNPKFEIQNPAINARITVAKECTASKWTCSQHCFSPNAELNSCSPVQPMKRGKATALQVIWFPLLYLPPLNPVNSRIGRGETVLPHLHWPVVTVCPSSWNLWLPSCSCASSVPSSTGCLSIHFCCEYSAGLCIAWLRAPSHLWTFIHVPPNVPEPSSPLPK